VLRGAVQDVARDDEHRDAPASDCVLDRDAREAGRPAWLTSSQ
jgi:hypothetical protein